MTLSADGAAVLCAAGEEVVEVATASGEVNQRWAPGGGAAALTVLSVSPGAQTHTSCSTRARLAMQQQQQQQQQQQRGS